MNAPVPGPVNLPQPQAKPIVPKRTLARLAAGAAPPPPPVPMDGGIAVPPPMASFSRGGIVSFDGGGEITGEDTTALWNQQEEDERKRQEAYLAGPLPPPAGPPTYTPSPAGAVVGGLIAKDPLNQAPSIRELAPPAVQNPAPDPIKEAANTWTPSQVVNMVAKAQELGLFDNVKAALPALAQEYTAKANAGDVPVPSGDPRIAGAQQANDNLARVQQILGPGIGGTIRDTAGKGISAVLDSPALNLVPGGTAANAGLNAAGVNTPSVAQAYSQDIPVVSDVMRNTVVPAAGEIGAQAARVTDPLGIGSAISGAVGGPSAQDVGREVGKGIVPVSIGDWALNAALAPKGASLLERLDPIGISGLVNPARAAVSDVPIPSRGQPAFGAGSRGGIGPDTAFTDAVERAKNVPLEQQWVPKPPETPAPGMAGGGTPPAPTAAEAGLAPPASPPPASPELSPMMQQVERARAEAAAAQAQPGYTPGYTGPPPSYPAGPPGTMAEQFPEIAGTRQYNTQGQLVTVNPNSPASRMGAPEAYNPANFPPTPEVSAADTVMREAGAAPNAVPIPPGPNTVELPVFRGSGREEMGSVYGSTLKEPMFPGATYGAFTEKEAATYGPNVVQETMRLDNPLTLTNNAQWRELTQQAGWPYPNMISQPQQRELLNDLQALIRDKGYDGIIVKIDRYGDNGSLLRDYFNHDQAIQFERLAPTPPSNAVPIPPQPEVGQLQPPGSGSIRNADAIAADEGLSQAARDFLQTPNGQAAAAQREAAQNAGLRPGETATVGSGGTGQPPTTTTTGGSGFSGGYQPSSLRGAAPDSAAGKIFNALMDASYAPLGGDIGTALRQDASQMLNITNLKQNAEVIGYAARFGTSVDEAVKAKGELDAILDGLKTQYPNLKINLPDIQGVSKGAEGFVNREVMSSQGLGKVPIVGLPFNITARANSGELYARRVLELQRFADNLPNRILTDPAKASASMQTAANMYERFTGRGSLGGGRVEKALSATGPLFTSLRFALSIPQRVPYLIPFTRLADGSMQIAGPVWREAVREHAGFFATTAGIMGLAAQAGADVDWDKGTITVGNTHINLWAGASQYMNMIRDGVTGQKNGLPYPSLLERSADGTYRGTVAEFVRNKIGPLPQLGAEALKAAGVGRWAGIDQELKFLRPDFWEKGAIGKGTFLDRVVAHVAPLWTQDVIEAVQNAPEGGKTDAGVLGGALSFFGAGVQSYGGANERERSQARNELAINDPVKTFGPDLAKLIPPETRYGELGSREKAAVNAQLSPEQLAQWRKDAAAAGNPVEKALMHQDAIRSEFAPKFDRIQEALNKGLITPYEARTGAKSLEAQMNETVHSVKLPEAGGDYKPSQIQQAEQGYRALYDLTKGADGKQDYDKLERLQLDYVQAVMAKYGDAFGGRLLANVLPGQNPSDPKLLQFYDSKEMRSAVGAYFNLPDDQKAGFKVADPQRDALLYAGGYTRTLASPAAAEAYKTYSEGKPEVNFNVGFRQEGYQTYRQMESGPMGKEVKEYQATATLDRDDYLRAHPDLNAALWQHGHTSHIYSLDAYDRVTGKTSTGATATVQAPPPAPAVAAPQGSVVPVPSPAPAPQQPVSPLPTGAPRTLPPVAPGEFNSATASPQQRANFIEAIKGPANDYAYTKIPPAVFAAIGASESNYGRAPSIFGIKGVGSAGGANLATREVYGGQKVNINDQFAAYNNLDDAFNHFIDLTSHGRYANSWNELQRTGDWEEFLRGITAAGYATDKNWPASIISLTRDIERNYPQINRR